MARTQIENYTLKSSRKGRQTFILNTNNMASSTSPKKPTENSSSTHSSHSTPARRTKVATSMRKFLEEDDDFDYLGKITSSRDMCKNPTRKKTPSSYRKSNGDNSMKDSTHSRSRRQNFPPSTQSSGKGNPTSRRKNSSRELYEGNLNDQKPREGSTKSLMQSARKLVVKAARAASPGRLRRDRSKSPGPQKIREKIRGTRSSSPTTSSTELSSSRRVSASNSPTASKRKPRAKSPGRLKKKENQDESGESPRSARAKSRSSSPGRLSKRSKSPGKMKKRSQSPGAVRKARPHRRPENGADNSESNDDSSRRRRARNASNGALKKPERARSHDRHPPKSRRGMPRKPTRSTRSTDEPLEGELSLKEENDSSMRDESNRYKVKRNKSMDTAMAAHARKNAEKAKAEDEDSRQTPRRAESMMLSREMGRRGKANSLLDLVQYNEEEIHSTSYFASNHVLINRERMKRGLRPLTRNVPMDELARNCAEKMAVCTGLQGLPTTYVGNVLRGDTIRSIHRSTMLQKQGRERANILNPYFQDFGVGTCKGKDGMLYMCQLFSERIELALTDTIRDGADESE